MENFMYIRCIIFVMSLLFANYSIAKEDFSCKLFIHKNTCWNDFDVMIDLYDPYEKPFNAKANIAVKKDALENSIEFPCKGRDFITLRAKFSPTIWAGKEDELYKSKKTWVVPLEIDDNAIDWRISVCFPGDFQSVPQPTGVLKDCKCLRKVITTIKIDDTEEEQSKTKPN